MVIQGMVYFHVWFSTKRRVNALAGELGERAKRLMSDAATRAGAGLLEIECVYDHVHLLLALSDKGRLPAVVQTIKGSSSRYLHLEFPELAMDMRHTSFWQKGYGARMVPGRDLPAVRPYIQTQHERPPRRS